MPESTNIEARQYFHATKCIMDSLFDKGGEKWGITNCHDLWRWPHFLGDGREIDFLSLSEWLRFHRILVLSVSRNGE